MINLNSCEKSSLSILNVIKLLLLNFWLWNVYLNKKSATYIVKANKDVATLIEIFNGNIFLFN